MSGVTVNNSGRNDYLSVSWLPAPGDVDNYVVTLSHDGRVVQSLIIAKSVSECSFSSLTPGRLYNVTITTRSGNYASHSFSEERTGKDYDGTGLSETGQLCDSEHLGPAVVLDKRSLNITKLLCSLPILAEKYIHEETLHFQEHCPSFRYNIN